MEAAARKQRQLNECILWAADKNNVEKLKFYLSEGARVDKEDPYKRTSLIKASRDGNIEAFELLVSYGASVNKADVDGETALIHATYKGHFDIACRLIELGADVNHKNKNDETAVYIACKYGNYDCVRRLITVGGDHSIKSKFNKTPLDVAFESMSKAQRQKRDDMCDQLERIVQLLSDEDGIKVLQKQEKMFTLTPEEFRTCLERSEYRPSGINVRVLGLDDHSTMAVTRALLRRPSYSNEDCQICDGIRIDDGYCEINIETGEWVAHDKITENEQIHRQIGEVVRNYVNTHNFEEDQKVDNQRNRKLSALFRSNTSLLPTITTTDTEPLTFDLSSGNEDKRGTNILGLQRSHTSASLYSLKSERSAVTLSGMELSLSSSNSLESDTTTYARRGSLPSQTRGNVRQILQSAKKRVSKAARSAKQRMDALINANNRQLEHELTQTIKGRKQVYDIFEQVKRAMKTDNSQNASVSVCSLSSKYEFTAVHRLIFASSAIYVFALDTEADLDAPCCLATSSGINCTNWEYLDFLFHLVSRRNGMVTEEKSKVLFVLLHEGEVYGSSKITVALNTWLQEDRRKKHLIQETVIPLTFEELYTERFSVLTSQITQHARAVIEKRISVPANWLVLKEALCSVKEIIITKTGLIETCINSARNVSVPSKQSVKEFLQHMNLDGKILLFNFDNYQDIISIDLMLPYHLVKFLRHSKIIVINDKNQNTPLIEKLSILSGNFDNMKATKCYIHEDDNLWKVAKELCFVSTDLHRRPSSSNSNIALYIPLQVTSDAPETLALQFKRLDRTAYFRIKTNHDTQLKFIFDSLSSAFFGLWPVKEIHNKLVCFRNLVVFTIDDFHFVSLATDKDTNCINVHITRTDVDRTSGWHSKNSICSGVFRITKHCLAQIFDLTLSLNASFDCAIEVPTCSLTPSCMVNVSELEDKDSFSCPHHSAVVDPLEILEEWKYCKIDGALNVEDCSLYCNGINSKTLSETITDTDFCKVIRRIPPTARRKLLATLKAEVKVPVAIVSNVDETLLRSLVKWRSSIKQPKFADLQKLLISCGETNHILCKMYREPSIPQFGNVDRRVHMEPLLLNQLSVRLAFKCIFLALQVGLDVVEYDRLLKQHRQNIVLTTRVVLTLLNGRTLADIVQILMEISMDNENLNEIVKQIQRGSV